jgi:hypothetical protein
MAPNTTRGIVASEPSAELQVTKAI